MEAKKTLDRISSDWVLWKRELDKEVIESDRKTELDYAQEQAKKNTACNFKKFGVSVQIIAQAAGLSEAGIAEL